jgi:hypothetical protein
MLTKAFAAVESANQLLQNHCECESGANVTDALRHSSVHAMILTSYTVPN